jgi:Leucine-rich repeat (LRR) protein
MGNGIVLDNYVTTANINTVAMLNISGKSITDLTGIQDFTALTSLDCYYNQLTSLNVTGLTNLQTLQCNENQLTSLDVTGLANLQTLHCYQNQLTSLNVIKINYPV